MSWPISHTDEGRRNAATNIAKLSRKKLEIAAISWKKVLRGNGKKAPRFNVQLLPLESLRNFVIECALGEFGRCTNGGWNLYVDAEGWIQVPFSMPKLDSE
jgi:hypothetical protein